jgi:uncharacterized membrane protein YuzA (DUF378 family)
MNLHSPTLDNKSMADKASITTYIGGGISAFFGFITSQEFGILFGMVIGIAGLFMNYYFKKREDKYKQAEEMRKQQLHEITLQNMANKD